MLCRKKSETYTLDEIQDVKITRQSYVSGTFQKVVFNMQVLLNTNNKVLQIPISNEEDLEREEFVNKIAYDLSILLSNHKRRKVIITVEDLGTKNIE